MYSSACNKVTMKKSNKEYINGAMGHEWRKKCREISQTHTNSFLNISVDHCHWCLILLAFFVRYIFQLFTLGEHLHNHTKKSSTTATKVLGFYFIFFVRFFSRSQSNISEMWNRKIERRKQQTWNENPIVKSWKSEENIRAVARRRRKMNEIENRSWSEWESKEAKAHRKTIKNKRINGRK